MKIALVCYPTFGGSGIIATELGKGLALKGHDIHFFSYKMPVRLNKHFNNIFFHEVSVFDYPLFEFSQYEISLVCKLYETIKYEKIDLLHVHYAIPHAFVAYLVKKMLNEEGINIPIVTTLHGTDISLVGKSASLYPIVKFSINKSDVVTCVSNSLKDETINFFSIKKEINVIPNFINFKKKKENLKIRSNFADKSDKILIHVSNFRPVKKVNNVFKIFTNLRTKINAKLILVGDGPDRSKIENICRNSKFRDDVYFTGKLESIDDLLSISDLFILPSEKESFGLVALEAMSHGLPVISSNSGGIINEDKVTGFTSNYNDIEKMSNDAVSILSNKILYEKFSENALNKAKNYDISRILPLYEKIYNNLIKF